MMTKTHKSRPWHEVVSLKEELRTGELSLAQFAADLHEVTLAQRRRPVYEDPEKFFALTYPTHALRELVKDVAARLAGQSDKAVRQLELTYGGGKTHTLITLYHLFRDPAVLPDLPAVHEFREHVGADLPRAFTVALCFDKIDVERGIEGVRGPDGETRTLRHPWSVLAFQLAGADGLRALHAEGRDEERETPPAEPLLAKLIERPAARGLATLILVDEVLMYAREKAGVGAVWRDRIVDFFQSLTQAVVKVDRAAIVASLLATDPSKQRGDVGQRLVSDLFDVFLRQREEGVQPVQKEDVAEVLRRRFFEPDDVRDPNAFRSHVIGVVRVSPSSTRPRPGRSPRPKSASWRASLSTRTSRTCSTAAGRSLKASSARAASFAPSPPRCAKPSNGTLPRSSVPPPCWRRRAERRSPTRCASWRASQPPRRRKETRRRGRPCWKPS